MNLFFALRVVGFSVTFDGLDGAACCGIVVVGAIMTALSPENAADATGS
jgi:hypothetical protein